MKKILFAAAAVLALASCSKDEVPALENKVSNEISFMNIVNKTKGYITDVTFYDTAIDQLHIASGDPVTTPRTMQISAYLTPQDGDGVDYFRDYTFEKGADPDTKWHHTPAIYWPLGGKLDFLAYSSKIAFDSKDVEWDERNASESVSFDFNKAERLKDDLVYAAASQTSADGATSVAMEFKHAQAWIEFKVKVADEDMKDKLAITGITLENIYTSGKLTVSRSGSTASHSWNYRHEVAEDLIMQDDYNMYGTQADATPFAVTNGLDENFRFMDVLIPEQEKTDIVISYALAGQQYPLTYRFNLPNASSTVKNWVAGEKYVYEIVFTVNEITVAPKVKEYTGGTVSDLTPTSVI